MLEQNLSIDRTNAITAKRLGRSRRMWLFRAIAVAIPLLSFVLFEYVLRAIGVGQDTRFVIRCDDVPSPNAFRFNPAADRAYYGPRDISGPDPRPFEIPQDKDQFRIVVVGGSTVVGFPYPFELALPKQLEVILNEQFPEKQFEVLNAGITSINSFSEVDIVEQLLEDCPPDLIIVHSGHNEFYGPGGSASTTSRFGPQFYLFMQSLRRQRTFQLALSAFPSPEETHLIETLPSDIDIAIDGPIFRKTVQRYEANLTRIVDMATQVKVPVIISTVPSNLRDLAPLEPTVDKRLLDKIKEAESRISYQEFEAALAILRDATKLDPSDPLLMFRTAQCLENLGQASEAAKSYRLASDLDGCRFRAPQAVLDVVRSMAQSRQDFVFCDVAKQLQSRSEFPAPGNDYFLEHVHYNYAGTWEAASILAETVVEQVLDAHWQSERLPNSQRRDELLGMTRLDHLAADSLTLIIFEAWPLKLSSARGHETNLLRSRISATFESIDPAERELFSSLSMNVMEQHLWLAMGESWLALKQPERAEEVFQRHLRRKPWESRGYLGAAAALDALGKSTEAAAMRERAENLSRIQPTTDSPN